MDNTIKNTSSDLTDFLTDYSYEEGQPDLFVKRKEKQTQIEYLEIDGIKYPKFINEFWTSRQRQASSIHEIAYRACFKPQLPRFFIKLLTQPNDRIYDPFSGRGTTMIESALLGRNVAANDINPISQILSVPRLLIPDIHKLEKRLKVIPIKKDAGADIDLSMFYHPQTEAEIVSLKSYLQQKCENGEEDALDKWIRMVATNRLTGHSSGFFSVYTLPPNQAISPERQKKINQKREQIPEYRNTRELILRKTQNMIKNFSYSQKTTLLDKYHHGIFLIKDARKTNEIENDSIKLTVTSPPFLNVVQYSDDNWLRCWFNEIDTEKVAKKITMARTIDDWNVVMDGVFKELYRITQKNGWVAFEVGEVRNGKIKLEEYVIPLGVKAGFDCEAIVINQQQFTKTSNIWGVKNNTKGTNSNRIVVFRKS